MQVLKLEKAEDVKKLALRINKEANMGIDLNKVVFLRSRNSKTTAIARTLTLPPQWRYVLGEDILYIVEVVSEKFDNLECNDKIFVITHELMHIPRTMKGLRNHNYKGFKQIRRISKELAKELC
ncbi:metallopeptidase-like protein [Acidianus hospitalis W1]|uniref:Metallopeptidase-like protein n=1 Tax=Acidianus hospitalis (strain W1) TaxID=933801 RepID=F4B996_ACIHW|nr:putative metallopeptidase [Acidianus hospitalis]AEE93889.1 metallopeptidase-like protein [Acidianus hospitalis W1]